MEVYQDGEVVRVESGGRLPPGCKCQVGAAEGEVRGGRGTVGWQTGGEVGVQEAEGTIVGVLDD